MGVLIDIVGVDGIDHRLPHFRRGVEIRLADGQIDRVFQGRSEVKNFPNAGRFKRTGPLRNPMGHGCFLGDEVCARVENRIIQSETRAAICAFSEGKTQGAVEKNFFVFFLPKPA